MTLEEASISGRERSMYSELLHLVRDAGLLRHRRGYYAALMSIISLLLLACILAFVELGDAWWQLLTAAALGVIFTQVGFIVHDAGHQQIGKSRRSNHLLGALCADIVIGFSFGWWVDKHRRHHLYPNREGFDPDISSKIIAFSPGAMSERYGFRLMICRHQAVIAAAALPFQSVAMRIGGFRFLSERKTWWHKIEFCWLIMHMSLYLTGVFLVLSPWKAIAFVSIQQGVMGAYFGLAFAPNHKGMPITSGEATTNFLVRQVVASRNIQRRPVSDLVLAGLNYQIEHHLFPSMPRPSLRKAAPLVREFCQLNCVPYVETTLTASYLQAFGYLSRVGQSGIVDK